MTLEPATAQAATVSPDGRSVAFLGARNNLGPPDCGESVCPAFALYIAGVSGKNRRRVANDTGPAGWSPDGKTLVYVARGALTLLGERQREEDDDRDGRAPPSGRRAPCLAAALILAYRGRPGPSLAT
jgi:Tol biopolymer transport system component